MVGFGVNIEHGNESRSLLFYILPGLTVTLFSLAFYRLFLSPLANFPGPKLAALTGYYEGYYDVIQNGQYTFQIAELHKQYGPIIRISPHELHINDTSFYEKLYRQDGYWDKYAWSYDAFGAPLSSICTIDHNLHRLRRAPLNAFFSKANIANRQGIIQSKVKKLASRIQEFARKDEAFNLGAAFSATMTDVATEYTVGSCYNNLDRSDFGVGLMNMLQGSGAMWRVTKQLRFLGPMVKAMPLSWLEKTGDPDVYAFVEFLRTSNARTKELVAEATSASTNQIDNIDDTSRSPHTIVHQILSTPNLPEAQKALPRINDEVDTITGAGLETVAHSLRFIVYNVYSHPATLSQLRSELHQVQDPSILPGEEQTPTLSQLEQLPYLTAVITEGLRLSPGLATRLARIAPDRDIVYDNKWVIPRGTPVGMTALLMHWDPSVYPSPRTFRPERWIDDESGNMGFVDGRTYAPFSRGTRICLGMHLAWAELYITLAMLVRRFDFEFVGTGPEDVEPHSDQFIIGTKSKKGVIAKASLCSQFPA